MIVIRMAGGFGQSEFFGPAPFFELDREALRQGPERTVIARHVRHAWQVGQQHYSSWEVEGPLIAIFTDTLDQSVGSLTMGPFSHLRVANGFAYGDTRLVAEFTETISKWCSKLDDECWPVIELRSAMS
jgi:hypothetical protein